jgi:hypothetical protein
MSTITKIVAPKVQATNKQQVLFREWAFDCVFVLDIHDSPKRQFCILAKMLGWVGGEEPWNAHWKACFGEEYVWRARLGEYWACLCFNGVLLIRVCSLQERCSQGCLSEGC